MTTKPDENALTTVQEIAIAALVRGASITDAAKEAGVARQTVSVWKNHDPMFMAALNQARRDVWDHAEDRLRTLVTKSLERIDRDLDEHGDVDTALSVLKALGRIEVVPRGLTSPRQIANMQRMEELLG